MAERSRTALVTGASAGLGESFARQLAERGYDLVLVARRLDRLEALAERLRKGHGVTVTALEADLANPQAPAALHEELQARGVLVDYLVNNAGSAGPDLLADRDWSLQHRFLQLMMIAPAHLCHLFIPAMREQCYGRVINVASMAGRLPRPGGCNYGPSKAYLIALSEDLSVTLKGTGVNVCALCPGFTHTEFHEAARMTEFKRRSPGILWYDADTVVREGLCAVERGKAVYASGRLYRILDPFTRLDWSRRLIQSRTPNPAAD